MEVVGCVIGGVEWELEMVEDGLGEVWGREEEGVEWEEVGVVRGEE